MHRRKALWIRIAFASKISNVYDRLLNIVFFGRKFKTSIDIECCLSNCRWLDGVIQDWLFSVYQSRSIHQTLRRSVRKQSTKNYPSSAVNLPHLHASCVLVHSIFGHSFPRLADKLLRVGYSLHVEEIGIST